jgi:hypothetical protein
MIYSYPAWELVADTHLLKLQRMQNKTKQTKTKQTHTGPRFAQGLNLPYVYDYIKNRAGDKQKSYKIMRMNMFAV